MVGFIVEDDAGPLTSSVASPNEAAREERERTEAELVAGLTRLRAWFEEWSGVAKVAVKRRDYLIRMGLAARRSPAKTAPQADGSV